MPENQPGELPSRRRERSWTRPEDYLDVDRLVRRALRQRAEARRQPIPTEAREPRALLGVIPFLLLMVALAVLTVMVMIAGFPGRQHYPTQQAQNGQIPVKSEPEGQR